MVERNSEPRDAHARAARASRMGTIMRQTLTTRAVRTFAPSVVVFATVVGFAISMATYSRESPHSGLAARLWASLMEFAGSYTVLPGQDASPSTPMAIGGLLSTGATFVAAIAAGLELTSSLRNLVRARGAGSNLVVIGNGEGAANLLRSPLADPGRSSLAVTDEPAGLLPIVAPLRIPLVQRDLGGPTVGTDLGYLCRRARAVAVATRSDARNLAIATSLSSMPNRGTRSVMAVVSHPLLADELRPIRIGRELGVAFGVTSPSENIAERICHHVDKLLLSNSVIRAAGHVELVLDCDDGSIGTAIRMALRRLATSRAFLRDASSATLPTVRVTPPDDPRPMAPIVEIIANRDPARAASLTLRLLRVGGRSVVATIAVTDPALLGSRRDHEELLVVDPVATGWDHTLLFDDVREQWGRSYHYAYGVIFADGSAVEPWERVRYHREGQSSLMAVDSMLQILDDHGYGLAKVDGPPTQFAPGHAIERSMAQAEHASWRMRTWTSPTGVRRVADGRPSDVQWAELDESVQKRNVRVTTQTYPALAAVFGYEISERVSKD